MFPSHSDVLMKHEQYKDLLREAETERLSGAAGLRQFNLWITTQKISYWLGSQMVKWGKKLQSYAPTPLPEPNTTEV